MSKLLKKIVIVGGGTAGWITAGILAAKYTASELKIVLIESPDVKTIGVGEGTWPTMRETLKEMGISELEFIRETNASFKQGSQFVNWVDAKENDVYFHPFALPQGFLETDLVSYWQSEINQVSYANAFSPQVQLCENNLAPKQIQTPDYAAVANYAYHLDAGKFSKFLQEHCTKKLGVEHVLDHVTGINSADNLDIASLQTKHNGNLTADLFIDCTGHRSLLLGDHFDIPFLEQKQYLFNNKAMAVQVPYQDSQEDIASATISTAQEAGWIWDIALANRRGVGYVYSDAHSNDEEAERTLRRYIEPELGQSAAESATLKRISFVPGYRQKFWHKNCVAVGMSAGFIEPLEASAIALVELSAKAIRDQLPVNREQMEITAQRFNQQFTYRWERVIDFLKLHYVLSQRRDTDFWRDNQKSESIPESLQAMFKIWVTHPPSIHDLVNAQEIFPTASFQYVLYGMRFPTKMRAVRDRMHSNQVEKHYRQNAKITNQYIQGLPTNRELLNYIHQL